MSRAYCTLCEQRKGKLRFCFVAEFPDAYNMRVQEVLDYLYEQRKEEGEEEPGYEWEGYDGWYNNPAHPDWGGAGTLLYS